MSKWYLVRLLGCNGEVVYQIVIKTPRLVRVLDATRAWLAGNDNKYDGREVVSVESESIDAVGVL